AGARLTRAAPSPTRRANVQRVGEAAEQFFDASFGDQLGEGEGRNEEPDQSAACPPVPTGVGDIDPDPQCPTATHAGTKELSRFTFCLDSDRLAPAGHLQDLSGVVRDNPPSTRFLVHGYASPEGNSAYNFRLACHRANRIAEQL